MKQIIVAAKIQYSVGGAITTLGVASAPYFASASGLLNRTWYPILDSAVSVAVDVSLPWDSGSPSQQIGDIMLTNGGDGEFQHVLDLLIPAQLAGLVTEVRRGYTDQSWDELPDLIFKARNASKRFDGESLIIPQRPFLDRLDQPIAQQVFDETTPNPRIVNSTVPLLLGRAFQIEPLIWDAPNQIYYTAQNLSEIDRVLEGGAVTLSWTPVEFGHQMTAGVNLQVTVDAIGPPPDAAIETTVIDWTFDAWTAGLPDGINVTDSPPDAVIAESAGGGAADITVTASVTGDTGWLSLTAPAVFSPWGAVNTDQWSASSGALADAFTLDNSVEWANVTTWRSARIMVTGFDSSLPAGSTVVGAEMELVYEGSGAILADASLVRNNGFQVAPFAQIVGGFPQNIPAAKTTSAVGSANTTNSLQTVTDEDIADGFGFSLAIDRSGVDVATAKIHQVRAKLHHSTQVQALRLESPSQALTAGRRYRVEITTTDSTGDVWARWGSVAATGDPITTPNDPFATVSARLEGEGLRVFEFTPDAVGLFAIEFSKSTSAGQATVGQIRVVERPDGINTYAGLVPYVAGLVGIDTADIDQTMIDAHDSDTGSPEIGWYITANESMAEVMDLFARSLSGVWWPDRDGKLRSVLWTLDPDATPDVTISNITVDGRPQRTRIQGNITLESDPAPNATERAVGARNWRPLRVSETAGIAEEFSEQERANVIEAWRVRRRANFAALNPWPVPPPPLSVSAISPSTGEDAGGTAVTVMGESFDSELSPIVWIGSQRAANAVVVDKNTITCTTPAQSDLSMVSVSPTEGAAGDPVTITGTGFQEGAVVKFGTVEATDVVIVTDTEMTCTVPEQP